MEFEDQFWRNSVQEKEFPKRKELVGGKVILKEGLTEEDYPLLLEWFTDVDSVKYLSFARDAVALRGTGDLKKLLEDLETGPIFAIHDKENGFVGYASFSDYVGKKESGFSIFILDKESQGKGIGYETTMLMLDHAFHDLGLEKVYLETSEFHEKAIGLYKKAGFRRTELVPNDRVVFHDNVWIESGTVVMEITQEEYEFQKNGK
jgi:RimJ/RimL family protein N-acetyltransferase